MANETVKLIGYGGGYLEESQWWKKKQNPSLTGGLRGLFVEFALLHSTFRNNRSLWLRTYPFHLGLYTLAGTVCLAAFASILISAEVAGDTLSYLINVGKIMALMAFLGIGCGSAGLIHRRLTAPDLNAYSTSEHFLNLGLFLGLSVLGLLLWLTTPCLFERLCLFMASLITFRFSPQDGFSFNLFIICLFLLTAYIPATHMAHFFMKYFLWHDIRWGAQPVQDNPGMQKKIAKALSYPISWKGDHIHADSKKTWAEAALDKPAPEDRSEGGNS